MMIRIAFSTMRDIDRLGEVAAYTAEEIAAYVPRLADWLAGGGRLEEGFRGALVGALFGSAPVATLENFFKFAHAPTTYAAQYQAVRSLGLGLLVCANQVDNHAKEKLAIALLLRPAALTQVNVRREVSEVVHPISKEVVAQRLTAYVRRCVQEGGQRPSYEDKKDICTSEGTAAMVAVIASNVARLDVVHLAFAFSFLNDMSGYDGYDGLLATANQEIVQLRLALIDYLLKANVSTFRDSVSISAFYRLFIRVVGLAAMEELEHTSLKVLGECFDSSGTLILEKVDSARALLPQIQGVIRSLSEKLRRHQ